MDTTIVKVGIREFREHLQEYLTTTSPVAVTRHGETIGFYIPARHQRPDEAQLDALKQAAEKLEQLLSVSGVTEDELFAEYRTLRKNAKAQKERKEREKREARLMRPSKGRRGR